MVEFIKLSNNRPQNLILRKYNKKDENVRNITKIDVIKVCYIPKIYYN